LDACRRSRRDRRHSVDGVADVARTTVARLGVLAPFWQAPCGLSCRRSVLSGRRCPDLRLSPSPPPS
jgi:hypothetical protein